MREVVQPADTAQIRLTQHAAIQRTGKRGARTVPDFTALRKTIHLGSKQEPQIRGNTTHLHHRRDHRGSAPAQQARPADLA
jgi:hypothetical protein